MFVAADQWIRQSIRNSVSSEERGFRNGKVKLALLFHVRIQLFRINQNIASKSNLISREPRLPCSPLPRSIFRHKELKLLQIPTSVKLTLKVSGRGLVVTPSPGTDQYGLCIASELTASGEAIQNSESITQIGVSSFGIVAIIGLEIQMV